jgi:hypothetical protein
MHIRFQTATLVLSMIFALASARAVTIEDADDAGQAAFKVTIDNATFFLQKAAGALSSLVDNDGNDWIGAGSATGSSGMYRGIPNLVHPGNIFHPMYSNCNCSKSDESSESKATVVCDSKDGAWSVTYDFYDSHCQITVTKMARAYWFLYEGTPGGAIEYNSDFYIKSDGSKKNCGVAEEGKDIPDPEWIAFGDPKAGRVLFLHNLDDDNALDDYWPMENHMTVFGFGRGQKANKYLNSVPKSFNVGLIESLEYETIKDRIKSIEEGPVAIGRARPNGAVAKTVTEAPVAFSQPSSGAFRVRVASERPHRIALVNAAGKIVQRATGMGACTYVYGTGRLAKGIYLVRLSVNGAQYSRLFVLN